MTIKELLSVIENELEYRRSVFHDDPRNVNHNPEHDRLIMILRETAALIHSEFPAD